MCVAYWTKQRRTYRDKLGKRRWVGCPRGEFSGWQKGLAWRETGREAPGGVIFVNDSVVTYRHFTTARQLALVASIETAPREALVAFRDQASGTLAVAGLTVRLGPIPSRPCKFAAARMNAHFPARILHPRSPENDIPVA